MQKLSHQIYSFEGFALDLRRGCLLHGQVEIKLRPKSFEALKYLVENNRRLISKDELIHAVWIDTAVTDDSLVKCLKDIRHALSDEAQQIIKTVHGRGYIFDTEVSDNSTIARTTYTEETAGVSVIIEEEEETNGHGVIETTHLPASRSAGLLSAHRGTGIERLTTAIKQHRSSAVLGVLTLAVAAAAIVYFTRPREAIDSVAVMPFVNVSGDPNTEYLSDGISESIINSLSPNLKVIALNSVLRYKGKQTDPQAVGRELNVRALLTGRLTQRGDDLLINVELVDVRDNRHLWGQQYNRKLADIITVQAEIAQEVSERLRLRLSGDEKKQLAKRYTESGEAYQLYMMGSYYRRTRSEKGLQKSIESFEQAIKIDPNYAPAYAGLAETYSVLLYTRLLLPREARQKEEWAALKALEIDNELAEAHAAIASVRELDLNWSAAEQERKRALELNPNSAEVQGSYAHQFFVFGRFDEGMPHEKRAQELDPLSLERNADIATVWYFSRQYDRAIEQFQKTIEMDPTYAPAHARIALTFLAKGRYEDAIAEYEKARALDERSRRASNLGYAYALAGKRAEALKMLDELNEQAKQRYVSPYEFALVHIGLGEKDQAFAFLDKTYEESPDLLVFIKVSPQFDSLRSDPRFADLLRRMKLAP
jgi:TolB-like protein/DNA-binding winged helix-turn-helix (wHTH) protein/Tfp pilus assembly protein PilF